MSHSNNHLGRHISVMDIANVLSCHTNTVRNLIGRGELEAIAVGRSIRVPEKSVQEFLNTNRIRSNEQEKG